MIILVTLALCLSMACPSVLLINTSQLAQKFQQKCVQILPRNSQEQQSLSSLLCGEKITDPELQKNLQRTSLIHIFVISGSHLILLDELLSILRIPLFVRFTVLGLYSLAVGWQAPAVRALLGLFTRGLLQTARCSFPADLTVLITGLLTLTLFPDWWNSLSLVMSWCAALALGWPSLLRIRAPLARIFLAQISIFLFMCAPLWGLGSLHPLSLVYNLLLAPVVSYILLPLAFLTAVVPSLTGVFDQVMGFFKDTLAILAEPVVLSKGTLPRIEILWLWILFWQVFMHFLRLRLWQGRDSR
ncbi:ComEC/Rec2 family competence protein [Bdellovibrio bacteriovorus]|uniref:ComEC/Rec2 family competence protein n=1 Tax=Bdellovibrio bacteriovorus TaxID=959 RepID=UPI0021D2B942|nr:ComEC/Rec2 family competence protein [Bdellovibrio bacteriovorus]UXR63146.1 ComEC/Rec2 family competence protein [Bdellovibrio bacteriovorus]